MTEAPLAYEGVAAPPRSNGELVFTQPWESRAFGLVVSLHDSGAFAWETFQAALIARVAAWEAAHPAATADYRYYEHWLAALEDVLDADGTLTPTEVDARASTLSTRPAGHDHAPGTGHGHGHDHD